MSYKHFINNRLHLMVQNEILRIIGDNTLSLEHRFKGHIADIYWEKHGIVFEVQCSKMSLEECKKRTDDFESLGIRIVWILHQKSFNKPLLSPMEQYLLAHKNVYYTNISQQREGIIFDQEQAICYGVSRIKSPPIQIDLSKPIYRLWGKKVHFKGDKKDLGIIKRFVNFPDIWKEKWHIKKNIIKRKSLYYYTYLKWSIKI